MSRTTEIITLLKDVLALSPATQLDAQSRLMGSLPELDSMAVVNLITALEDQFGITVHDDEIDAATFDTVASLTAYVDHKLGR
jgi:acyl carrier protein